MLLVACVAMVFVSCSKDDDGGNETPFGGKQISKIIYKEANGEVYSHVTYEYDKNGRVSTEVWREEGDDDIFKYTYGTDKITIINECGGETSSTDYYLENGIITYSMGDETATYKYNEKKELIEVVDNTHTYTYTWANGDITTQNVPWEGDYIYTYSEKENKTFTINYFVEDIPNSIFFSYGFFGKSNKNLMSGRANGSDGDVYEYEFDKDGNVTTMKVFRAETEPKTLIRIVTVEYK